MNIASTVDSLVRAVCPIEGIGIGSPTDKATWRIDFSPEATAEQRTAAAAVVTAFDVAAASSQVIALAQRRALDAQEVADARLNSAVTALLDSTPAQLLTWANNNFPTLTPAERARMGMIMNMIAVSMRPVIRS